MEKIKCLYCGKKYCKNGIGTHIWRMHGEGRTHNSNKGFKDGTRTQWNKGKTKDTCEITKKQAEQQIEKYKYGDITGPFTGHKHTDKTKKIISEKLSINNKGGRCKWYDVNGVSVQGTWERDIAIQLTKMNIGWIKLKMNNQSLLYIKDGKEHKYTPDFYLPKENIYLEIKGYWWGDDKRKMDLLEGRIPIA